MKKLYLLCFFILLVCMENVYSQNNFIDRVEVEAHTVQDPRIDYNIWFTKKIDPFKTIGYLKTIEYSHFSVKNNSVINSVEIKRGITDKGLKLSVVPVSNLSLIDIITENYPLAVRVSKDLKFYLPGGDSVIISPEELQEATITDNALIEKLRKDLQEVHSIRKKNDLNISKEVNNSDSSASEYIVDFDLLKPIVNDLFGSALMYELSGTVSTNDNNPLNTIKAYLKYKLQDNLYFEAGRIGPQRFDRNSIRANFNYETLIPNLIDLTNGAPRIRLKPYIKFGVGYQKNFQKNNPFNNSGGNLIVNLEGYYNIPVLEKYSLTAKFDAAYSNTYEVGEDVLFNYSITFGYNSPLEGLQVLLRVVNGQNEVNLGEATVYSLGVLLDFLPIN